MTGYADRWIAFAGSEVKVSASDERAGHILEFLFGAGAAVSSGLPLSAVYRLQENADGRLVLMRNDRQMFENTDAAYVAEMLMGEVCRQLAETARGGILFHAAALAWRGGGLLLPGGTAAGKSTLAALLTARGLDYLTDEMVFFPDGSSILHSFYRPLNLKASSGAVLESLLDRKAHPAEILSSSAVDLVLPSALNPASRFSQPLLNLIIFPRHQPGAQPLWEALTPAQAGLELMQCLVNARNLPDLGFAETATLARSAPAYRAVYNCFEEIEDELQAALSGENGQQPDK